MFYQHGFLISSKSPSSLCPTQADVDHLLPTQCQKALQKHPSCKKALPAANQCIFLPKRPSLGHIKDPFPQRPHPISGPLPVARTLPPPHWAHAAERPRSQTWAPQVRGFLGAAQRLQVQFPSYELFSWLGLWGILSPLRKMFGMFNQILHNGPP